MKNLILFLTLFSSLLFASCSSELEEPAVSNEANTHIQIEIPDMDSFRTRAYSDGLSVTNLKCYVYDKSKASGSLPIQVEDIPMHNYSGHKGAYYSLKLPKFSTYELVLLATSCPQNDTSKKISYNQAARTINLNYDDINPNDESLDCFWGVITNVSPDNSNTYSVTLKRPFAQLNIGTKDLSDYNSMASSALQSVAVSVKGVYSSMNVMDGKVSNKVNLSFSASDIPSGQTFPVSGNEYLSMNYLLVNERTEVDVTMTARNQTKSFDCDFSSIPLQRNYQTNIYGNLLTSSNDYNVEIVPDYDGREDKTSGYDLIFKVLDGTDHISLYYTTPTNPTATEINLKSYIDSNNIVKVSWDQLGITDANSIRFIEDPNMSWLYNKIPITEFIKFNISNLPLTSLYGIFSNCYYVEDLNVIRDWNVDDITNFAYMFSQCLNLKQLDTTIFKSAKPTSTSNMFKECQSLESLDLTCLNTALVTDMSNMFCLCNHLETLDLSSFDTRNVTDMSNMFELCHMLKSLNVSSFDTSKVTDMSNMFDDCNSFETLNLSNFNTSNVSDMSNMFYKCENLKSLNVSSFNTSKVTDMNSMFELCQDLESLDLSNFNTSKVTDMSNMFYWCDKLKSLNVSSFNTSNVSDMSNMFHQCESLTTLDLSSFDTRNVTDMSNMFELCSATVIWGPNGGLH